MGKFLKLFGVAAGLIILIIVAAIIVVPLLVDPDDYRGKIVDIVEKQTGRQVRILGDIELSVFPWLGVKAGAVEIGNAPGFDEPVFARWENLRIRLRILPLLSKKVEMGVVTVNGVTVNLSRRADGVTNWDDLTGNGEEKKLKEEKRSSSASAVGALAIGGVSIENATVRWNDQADGRSAAIKNIALKTSAITFTNPVEVTFSADFDEKNSGVKGTMTAACKVTADMSDERYRIDGLNIAADLQGKMLPGEWASVVADGHLSFDGKNNRLDLGNLKIAVSELAFPPYTAGATLNVSGRGNLEEQIFTLTALNIDALLSGEEDHVRAEITGKSRLDLKEGKVTLSDVALKLPGMKMKGYGADFTGSIGAVYDMAASTVQVVPLDLKGTISGEEFGENIPVSMDAGIRADLGKQTLAVDSFNLAVMDMKTVGFVSVEQLFSKPAAKGAVSVERFNLRHLLDGLMKEPLKTADGKALSAAELKADFSMADDAIRFDRLSAVLDNTRLSGSVRVRQKPSADIGFKFKVDRIDLNRYLPPQEASKKAAAVEAAGAPVAAAAGAAGLPMEAMRKLVLDGQVSIGSLKVFETTFSNIDIGFNAGDGILKLAHADADLYGGRLSTAATLDVRGDRPAIAVTEKVRNIQMDRLAQDMEVDAGSLNLAGPTRLDLSVNMVTDGKGESFDIRKLSLDGNLGGRLPMALDAKGALKPGEGSIVSEGFKLKLGEMNANGSVKMTGKGDQMGYETRLVVDTFNFQKLSRQLGLAPMKTSDAKALSSVAVTASVSGTSGSARVKDLVVRVDDTTLKGFVDVASFEPPSSKFDLVVDRMDVDRYLPPLGKGKKQAAATPGAALAVIPVEPIRDLSLDGKLKVGSLKIANLKLSGIEMQADAKDGRLTVHPLKANLYGGKYTGNIGLDATGKLPVLSLDEKLENVQAGDLLKDLQGKAFVTGTTKAGMTLTAAGADADAIVKSLDGEVAFTLSDGTIQGVDILGKVCRAMTAFSAGTLKKDDIIGSAVQMLVSKAAGTRKTSSGAENTAFSELNGTMIFSKGIGTNRDLILQSPLLRVEGEGALNLPDQSLDYKATVALVKSCEGQGGKRFSELANYPIPVRIYGPLSKPEVKPDFTTGIVRLLGGGSQEQQQQTTTTQEATSSGSSGPLSDTLSDSTQQQQAVPSQSQSGTQKQPADTRKQAEEALKGILQKGLQDLLKN